MTDYTQEYSKFVAGIWKPGDDISLDAKQRELLHVALLLTGEAAELLYAESIENTKEELGDLLFGLYALRNIVPGVFWLNGITVAHELSNVSYISIVTGDMADVIKKHCVYGQDLDHQTLGLLAQQLFSAIAGYALYLGVEVEDLVAQNTAKLSKRYPDGYSDAAAKARADKE